MVDVHPQDTIRIGDLLASIDAYNLNMIKKDSYDGNYFTITSKEVLEEALAGRNEDDIITVEEAAQLSYDITEKIADKNTYYSKKKEGLF